MKILETERLILGTWRDKEQLALIAINQDQEVMEHFPSALSEEETKRYVYNVKGHQQKYGYALYAATLKEQNCCIGFVGLNVLPYEIPGFKPRGLPVVEIGWRLARSAWGKGYATEGAKMLLHYAFFSLNLTEVISIAVPANKASIRVMEKIGLIASPKENFRYPKLPKDHPISYHVLYKLSRVKYLAQHQLTQLYSNSIAAHGEEGAKWFAAIPSSLLHLKNKWGLSKLEPMATMTWSYMVAARQHDKNVVVKLSPDRRLLKKERQALDFWGNKGFMPYIAFDVSQNALMFERAEPGNTLRELNAQSPHQAMQAYAELVKQLHSVARPKTHPFKSINTWLEALDKHTSKKIPSYLLKKAIDLKNELLATSSDERVLHGNLHLDNILLHHDEYRAIDPKGIVGERACEIMVSNFITDKELREHRDTPTLMRQRAQVLAEKLELNSTRIFNWTFVRLILGACWVLVGWLKITVIPNLLSIKQKVCYLLKNFHGRDYGKSYAAW